ncbi:MAG: HyaD/HybD family hydrogenase maturation endopeptidase [Syntrophales bacterium]
MDRKVHKSRILVAGIGNLLRKDEGIGVHLIHELEKFKLPAGVTLLDAGTGGISLIHLMEQASKVIFIDAAQMGKEPGIFIRFTPEEVRLVNDKFNFSFHQLGLPQVLQLAAHLDISCKVIIFGVQPGDLGWGVKLSPPLKRALPEITMAVLREIDNVGYIKSSSTLNPDSPLPT